MPSRHYQMTAKDLADAQAAYQKLDRCAENCRRLAAAGFDVRATDQVQQAVRRRLDGLVANFTPRRE